MTVSGMDMTRWTTITQIASAILVAVVCVVIAATVGSEDAQAAAFGELAQVGSFGAGSAGEFSWPSDMAVDTSNNSVYVLDEPGAVRSGGGPSSFRIQKFSASLGTPVASVTIPTPELPEEHHRTIAALAFDSQLHRLYVLEENEANEEEAYAGEIYVFTEALQPATEITKVEVAGVKEALFYKFPEAGETGALFAPHGLAVDPTTHDLVALGGGNEFMPTVLQRIAAGASPYLAGALGATFEDTGKKISNAGSASGISIAADGSLFLSVHSLSGSSHLPGVVKLTSNFATATIVAGDAGVSGARELTGGREGGVSLDYGPQVSVAPDEGLVYAVETNKPASGSEAGSYEVRGMSTTDGSQKVVFGGGTSPHCVIGSAATAVASGSGGVVYALDEGAFASGSPGHSSYGFDLVKFGPNGSGCPTPTASFLIGSDSSSPKVVVKKGEVVNYTAVEAGLNGEAPVELQWDLEGSGKYETKKTGTPPSLSEQDEYFTPRVYTVGLKILLENNGNYGNPPPVTRQIEVVAASPEASFEVSPQSPKPEEAVTFNAELSRDPTGQCTVGHGCAPTNKLKEYIWKFGDGQTVTKKFAEGDTYTQGFANTGHQGRQESVSLTVVNEEGTQSAPVTQSLTIQGTPEATTTTPTTTAPTTTAATTPPPPPATTTTTTHTPPPPAKPLTNAQKLTKALKACDKIKAKRKRSACVAQAKRKYGPKPKKKRKK